MKKNILFLLAAMALVVSSCDRKPSTTNTVAETDIAKTEMVILCDGQMRFYDFETNALIPFEAETDSVINVAYNGDKVYYTVTKNDEKNLELKMIDLKEADPQPKLCTDWQLSEEEIGEYVYGYGFSSMQFDANYEKIFLIQGDVVSLFYDGTVAYDFATGEVIKLTAEEFYTTDRIADRVVSDHFYSEHGKFYYASPEGNVCVNDKIDLEAVFEDENERNDLEVYPRAISPDGKQVVYTIGLYWGEEWAFFCVANSDGSNQAMLTDSDSRSMTPGWLADGTMVYVGKEGIKTIAPDGTTSVIAPNAERFYIKPFGDADRRIAKGQGSIEGCDMAIFDQGKLLFYNSEKDVLIPLETETDSVVNGVFDDNDFYYTVAIGDELYLKLVYMMDFIAPAPHLITDWELKLDDCVSETYGRMAPMFCFPDVSLIGISHTFNWDYYGFEEARFYEFPTSNKTDGWPEDVASSEAYEDQVQQYMEDFDKFSTENDNYYYNDGGRTVCVSNKIDFNKYISDPDYASDPEFDLLSVSPTRNCVAYVAYLEWGDLGHGPLCMASLDGKIQLAFEGTDAADLYYGWLSDGSLVYAADEGIYKVSPEGVTKLLSTAGEFEVR